MGSMKKGKRKEGGEEKCREQQHAHRLCGSINNMYLSGWHSVWFIYVGSAPLHKAYAERVRQSKSTVHNCTGHTG